MEKVLKSYDKEFMRMAMLKHEETFKEQVCELHRLYRIQKMLMKTSVEITQKNDNCNNNNNNEQNEGDYNERPLGQGSRDDRVGVGAADHAERIAESCNNHMEESDIELTLTLGPGPAHNHRLPRTDKSESGQSVSSSSTGSSQTRKASPKNGFKWGSESDPGFSKGQQNNPPWMFQALSLKLS